MLTEEEKRRYNRHIILNEIGEEGQIALKEARILTVGAGGLGSPVLLYLAAAGVGNLGIMDDDTVSESNLQRQILYDTQNLGMYKTEVAAQKLQLLNPQCHIDSYRHRLTPENANEIVDKYDIIVDATDNLLSRYIINDACVACHKPFVYGSICEFTGQVSVFNYKGSPTYRDLFEYHKDIPNFKQPTGVIGALPGVIGSLQAAEVIKIVLGKASLAGKLLTVDLLSTTFQVINL